MDDDALVATEGFIDGLIARIHDAASESGQVHRRRLRIGGGSVEMTVVGDRFAERFLPALRHAADDELHADGRGSDGNADPLRVLAWDRSVSSVMPPALPWSVDDILPNSVVRADCTADATVHYDRWVRHLDLYHHRRSLGIAHCADAQSLPKWMERSPFRSILTAWRTSRGDAVVHASSVVVDGGAVVLAGPSGSGKSTSMVHCLAAGLQTAGDDACIVSFVDDAAVAPVVRPMFGLAKLEPDAAARLDASGAQGLRVIGDEDGRPVLDLAQALSPQAPLRTVAITEIGSGPRTSWSPISAKEALHGLVDGSVAEGAGLSLAALRRLVSSVRCVRLSLGSDPQGIVATVGELAS